MASRGRFAGFAERASKRRLRTLAPFVYILILWLLPRPREILQWALDKQYGDAAFRTIKAVLGTPESARINAILRFISDHWYEINVSLLMLWIGFIVYRMWQESRSPAEVRPSEAPDSESASVYREVEPYGIRTWTFEEIHTLLDPERMKLKRLKPKLYEWYLLQLSDRMGPPGRPGEPWPDVEIEFGEGPEFDATRTIVTDDVEKYRTFRVAIKNLSSRSLERVEVELEDIEPKWSDFRPIPLDAFSLGPKQRKFVDIVKRADLPGTKPFEVCTTGTQTTLQVRPYQLTITAYGGNAPVRKRFQLGIDEVRAEGFVFDKSFLRPL